MVPSISLRGGDAKSVRKSLWLRRLRRFLSILVLITVGGKPDE